MSSNLNIHQRLSLVMTACPYVKKDTSIPGSGKGVSRDAAVAAVRRELLNNGVIAYTTQVSGAHRETDRTSKQGTTLSIYVGTYTTRFVNVDTPTDFIEITHTAEGQDYGDKAPGKAATYAEKLNILKGLMLETGIADEERNPDEGPEQEPEKPAIRAPKARGEQAAPAAEDNTPASKGLITMVKAEAEAKGILANVEEWITKQGHSWDKLPKAVAMKAREKIEKAKMREPGQEG